MIKKEFLQQIEDFYIRLGYSGKNLREVLARDEEYQKLLKEKKQKLTKRSKVTQIEKKKYVLSTDADFEILAKCKQLEKSKLIKNDKFLIRFIKTQLENDWRRPLLRTLDQLLKKYKQE